MGFTRLFLRPMASSLLPSPLLSSSLLTSFPRPFGNNPMKKDNPIRVGNPPRHSALLCQTSLPPTPPSQTQMPNVLLWNFWNFFERTPVLSVSRVRMCPVPIVPVMYSTGGRFISRRLAPLPFVPTKNLKLLPLHSDLRLTLS
jgi:hypothetical protein